MPEEVLAPIVTVAILAGLALWVPTLHFCNARCQQILGRTKANEATNAEEARAGEFTAAT